MKEKLIKILLGEILNEDKNEKSKEGKGELRIVILQRGWVFVGKFYQEDDNCWLEDANCIRNWGTTKGLGELAEDGPKSNTKLDPCPTVRFHQLGVVATIDCNAKSWKK